MIKRPDNKTITTSNWCTKRQLQLKKWFTISNLHFLQIITGKLQISAGWARPRVCYAL